MSWSIETGGRIIDSGSVRESFNKIEKPQAEVSKGGPSFADELKSAIQEVDELQKKADVAAVDVASGHSKNIHEAMIMMEKADIAFRTMVSMRNKVLEAYREIIRMQV